MCVGVSDAARTGYAILTSGGTAVDAVEAAVIAMENNPLFNAGKSLHSLSLQARFLVLKLTLTVTQYWINQEVSHNHKCDVTGTGNCSMSNCGSIDCCNSLHPLV